MSATTTTTKTPTDSSNKICDFYLSSRGCRKGDECDHQHPVAPNGAKTNKVCDFFGTPKGCSKGEECTFLHIKRLNPLGEECNKICSYYLTVNGCVKGMKCDFLHPRAIPANKTREVFQKAKELNKNNQTAVKSLKFGQVTLKGKNVMINDDKVCEYYLTPTGCNKGSECTYLHPRGKDAQDALNAKEALNKSSSNKQRGPRLSTNNNGTSARRGKKDNNNENKEKKPKREKLTAEQKKEKQCQFFKSENGCKKGEECEFKHE